MVPFPLAARSFFKIEWTYSSNLLNVMTHVPLPVVLHLDKPILVASHRDIGVQAGAAVLAFQELFPDVKKE